uniref:Methyltransferase FkbM domain-containing protein n=1 Tax=Parascaris univalens TaxID=6257 RepID=A0A914ZRP8_PARUN
MFIGPDRFSLTRLPNRDEVKFVRLPTRTLKAGDSCNIVTIGVGHDVGAEKQLQSLFPKICAFYGADPVEKINKELYESIGGRFFPFAVGSTSGNDTALVLGYEGDEFYKGQTVQHIDIVRFLRHYAGILSPIDVIILDVEGAEFEILPFLEPGNLLDDNNITVCQWNIELHWPSPEQNESFKRFIINTIRDERLSIRLYSCRKEHISCVRQIYAYPQSMYCMFEDGMQYRSFKSAYKLGNNASKICKLAFLHP